MDGRAKRKLKNTAADGGTFKKSAAAMVHPDLLIPGKRAAACAAPIKNAFKKEIPSQAAEAVVGFRAWAGFLKYNKAKKTPVKTKPVPTAWLLLKLAVTKCFRTKAAAAVGKRAALKRPKFFKENTVLYNSFL